MIDKSKLIIDKKTITVAFSKQAIDNQHNKFASCQT